MEETNLKLKFKIAIIMLILNTFSNDIIKQSSEILELKLNNTENKIDNINNIIDFLKNIDEFEIIKTSIVKQK